MESIPLISSKLIHKHIKYAELVQAVKKAFEEYSSHTSVQILRSMVPIKEKNGTLITMPSYSTLSDTLSLKIVTEFPNNKRRELPTIMSQVMLLDSETGRLLCMMDGISITAMRTAAASVVATQVVVTSPPKTLALVGSGVQAKSHIIAFCEMYNIEKVTIASRSFANAQKLCNELNHLPCHPFQKIEDAVQDADIVISATNATEPVICGRWLKPGCHINSVGGCRASWREFDDECMKNSVVYVDSKESAMNESGDIILSKCEIYAEIGEILLDKKPIKSGKRTFFKSLGFGLLDAVTAKLLWEKVKEEHNIHC